MSLKIDQHLRIVLPLDIDGAPKAEMPVIRDGLAVLGPDDKPLTHMVTQPYYVYGTPLSREVFQRYWLVFSKTFAQIYNEGLHVTAGPRIAAMAMRDIARTLGQLDGADGVEHGVFDEIRRTTTVAVPTADKGWQQVILDDAVRGKLISEEDFSEVENILAFFTVIFHMHRADQRLTILGGAARLWDAQIISSAFSVFIASLPKLTVTVHSGARLAAV